MDECNHNTEIPQEIFVLIGLRSLQKTKRKALRPKEGFSDVPRKTCHPAQDYISYVLDNL